MVTTATPHIMATILACTTGQHTTRLPTIATGPSTTAALTGGRSTTAGHTDRSTTAVPIGGQSTTGGPTTVRTSTGERVGDDASISLVRRGGAKMRRRAVAERPPEHDPLRRLASLGRGE